MFLIAVPISLLPAAKAAPAGRDLLFSHMDNADFVHSAAVQPLEEGIRQTEGIAFHFGASVQYENLHLLSTSLV
jgi:hypothetical protein